MNQTAQILTSLTLHDLTLIVTLGVFDFEKEKPQDVHVKLTLDFKKIPNACTTDRHNDSVCYASLSEHLQNFCHDKSFNMIEHLAMELSEQTQTFLNISADITLELFKKPPVENLNTASFKVFLPYEG